MMNFKYKLPPGYTIKDVKTEDFQGLWEKPAKRFFNEYSLFPEKKFLYSKKQLKFFKELREQFKSAKHYRLNLAIFYKNKFAGWSWGYQETPTTFYMCNSAILEQHRGKGLYTCLMREMMKRVVPLGYDQIYSRHIMTNNAILIAKLKQGFKITNFELSYNFGAMIHLTYFSSELANAVLDFRSGYKRPNQKMKKVFRL